MVKVNMAGVVAAGEQLPVGTYQCTVTSAKDGKTGKNEDKFTLEFTVDSPKDFEGRKAWRHMTFGEKALPFTKRTLINLGVDPDDLKATIDTEVIAPDLIGKECTIRVTEPRGDSTLNNVDVIDEDAWSN